MTLRITSKTENISAFMLSYGANKRLIVNVISLAASVTISELSDLKYSAVITEVAAV